MPPRARRALWAAAAALNGVAGLAAARCGGGACTRCLACAIPAAGVLLLALGGARRRDRGPSPDASARGPRYPGSEPGSSASPSSTSGPGGSFASHAPTIVT